jgi:hypothetical protein
MRESTEEEASYDDWVRDGPFEQPEISTISTKYAESRADHGLENFGDSL